MTPDGELPPGVRSPDELLKTVNRKVRRRRASRVGGTIVVAIVVIGVPTAMIMRNQSADSSRTAFSRLRSRATIPDFQNPTIQSSGTSSSVGGPDTDGDGLEDSIDSCPQLPGPADDRGCPRSEAITARPAVPAKPDLIITRVTWTPKVLHVRDCVSFAITVKNVGRTPTPSGVKFGVLVNIDSDRDTRLWSNDFSGPLGPGQSVRVMTIGGHGDPRCADEGSRRRSKWRVSPGLHTARFWVDDANSAKPSGWVIESNEANNVYRVALLA